MLSSLGSDAYRAGAANTAFLLHSTGNKPKNTEIDYAIIYADYYYIEALMRLKAMEVH
jgi:unsaturated chondroitin disaccharide hydrolase